MIDITGVDLAKFAQKVYELSVPRGLGFLHAKSGGLSAEEAAEIVKRSEHANVALSMDYVAGRGCKMTVFRNLGQLEIRDAWYDHTDSDLTTLLAAFGIGRGKPGEHGISCECRDCSAKRATV